MENKTIDDVMICPNCKSDNCYHYNTDEIEFSNEGTGHYFIDCQCIDCNHCFRLRAFFKYTITDIWT